MSQCKWDPSKHNGQACPVHGAGGQSSNGHKIRINGGKYQMKLSDDSDWEEISSEEYNDLREGGYQEFDETIDDDFGFDEMDEDAIWDAFDAGEINEEERNKLLSERSGQIANVDARPNETTLNNLDLSDSEKWNMAYQYIGTDKLEKLAEQLDLDSPQDIPTNELIKYMSDDEIADMMRVNGLDDYIDTDEDHVNRMNETQGLNAENSIEKGLTNEGRKLMADANKVGFGGNYDPMTGNISLSDKDLANKKDTIKQWLNEHPDYKLVKDETGDQAAWLTTDVYENDEIINIGEDKDESKESNNLDPNNPKYKGKSRSAITNAKLVDEGYTYTDANGKEVKESIIEYIPYGALQDGDNRKLYGIVRNYDGSDSPDIGAIVSPNLEDAKEQLESQIKLGIQGSDRYLKRGKYDEGFFNILRDYADDNDADDVETRKRYSEKYGWDYNKPFAEHDFMKDDPYEKWKSEREATKQSRIDNGTMEFIDNIAKKNSVNKEDYEKLKKSLVETFEEILRKQGK